MPDTQRIIKPRASVIPHDLVGKSLDGFTVQEYTEVYMTDNDGRISKSLDHFKDESIAKAFAGHQPDAAWHKTRKVLLLTDGKVAFVLGERVTLVDNEKMALEVKEAALKKLTPEERKVLGI